MPGRAAGGRLRGMTREATKARALLAEGAALQREGRHAEAAPLYVAILERDPANADALQLLGLALHRLGNPARALDLLLRAVRADPGHAPAHANLGVVLAALDRPAEAEAALARALAIRPDFPEAAGRLGPLLLARGDGPGAEAALRRARPTAPVLGDLGAALAMQGRLLEAAVAWRDALATNPEIPVHVHLADALAQIPDPPPMRAALGALLARDDLDHQRIAHALRAEVTGPDDPLFAPMLTRTIVADAAWEARLVTLRRASRSLPREDIAIQAWLTEYAWETTPGEADGLTGLAAAMYGPVPATPALAALMEPDDAEGIEILALSADRVSRAVRDQYEDNPYPRLVPVHRAAGALPQVPSPAPDVLVAGCGTGQHPLGIALRYPGARILAVDLSRASLARARRVARAHGIDNVRFAQADILALGGLRDRFDWIDCVGVLHHLADPLAGLRVLVGLLRPASASSRPVLRLGLYSERGRADVVDARARVAGMDLDSARAALRGHPVSRSVDFYSRSGFRDLVLHVQEHRYTPAQVAELLAAAGLTCTGLQHPRPEPARRYRERWPEDTAQADLARWDELERDHPRIFAGMIQVWTTC